MIVFSFTFRFLMKFELLLFMVYRKCPTLFFYMCMPSFSNIYLRRLFFLHWIILEPLSKIIWHIYGGLFLDFLLYSMFTCVFGTVSHCFAYCSLVVNFKSGHVSLPTCSFKIIFVFLDPLHFHMNFRINLSTFAKKKRKLAGILIGIALPP